VQNIDSNLIPLETLFAYKGSIRTLVNAIKVKRCVVSLNELSELVINNRHLPRYLMGVETITPVGSSLFSKVHGKFDISYFIAHRISQEFGIPLVIAKNPNKWRYKKRSMIDHKQQCAVLSPHFQTIPTSRYQSVRAAMDDLRPPKTTLVIDDVITTGFTLYQQILSTGFPQSTLKCLAVCDARSKKKSQNFRSLGRSIDQVII